MCVRVGEKEETFIVQLRLCRTECVFERENERDRPRKRKRKKRKEREKRGRKRKREIVKAIKP